MNPSQIREAHTPADVVVSCKLALFCREQSTKTYYHLHLSVSQPFSRQSIDPLPSSASRPVQGHRTPIQAIVPNICQVIVPALWRPQFFSVPHLGRSTGSSAALPNSAVDFKSIADVEIASTWNRETVVLPPAPPSPHLRRGFYSKLMDFFLSCFIISQNWQLRQEKKMKSCDEQ